MSMKELRAAGLSTQMSRNRWALTRRARLSQTAETRCNLGEDFHL